jgi:hypothetical protein
MEKTIGIFTAAVHNLLPSEKIPEDAAKDSLNFVTKDGKVVLVPGRIALGADGAVGNVTGLHAGYRVDGTKVYFAKFGTAIMYFDGTAWQNSITGLSTDDEYTFANYSSLAGSFTFVNGPGAFYKIVVANPGSPINVYNSAINFYGKILIDKARMLLWDRDRDKTGLYGSWIDRQDSTVYTPITNENLGSSGSTTYSGTLVFKSGFPTRSCFGVAIDSTVAAGAEVFTDNGLGVLTSNRGGTGTINYATGAYSVTFSAVTTAGVEADYQYEDSNDDGITDFSKSATRLAGEGFQFPQDEGGDPILNVLIGQDGAYYSLKQQSTYVLSIDADDLGATNEVYRKEMGLPFFRAAISTSKGIIFMNTSNPTKPEMTILRKSKVSDNVEPNILFPQFKFSNYNYDEAAFATYDRWIVVFCKTLDATSNNRMLLCNVEEKTVDIVGYTGRMGFQDGSNFLVGDSLTQTVYSTFSGFDDLGLPIQAWWDSKDTLHGMTNLKKERRLRIKGLIDPDQRIKVYTNIDEGGFQLVGTISGAGTYVNYNDTQVIGGNYIGQSQIGGDDASTAYGYYIELKVRTPKFRTIGIRLEPTAIGYFDFDLITHWDILVFEDRMPKIYRQKQNVSIDGSLTNQ